MAASSIALGTYFGGWRIIRTLGTKVIHLDPIHGFAAETSSAAVIWTASTFGYPISTTQTITASIMGAGATGGLSAVKWGVAGNIVWAWILTIPAAGLVAAGAYFLIHCPDPLERVTTAARRLPARRRRVGAGPMHGRQRRQPRRGPDGRETDYLHRLSRPYREADGAPQPADETGRAPGVVPGARGAAGRRRGRAPAARHRLRGLRPHAAGRRTDARRSCSNEAVAAACPLCVIQAQTAVRRASRVTSFNEARRAGLVPQSRTAVRSTPTIRPSGAGSAPATRGSASTAAAPTGRSARGAAYDAPGGRAVRPARPALNFDLRAPRAVALRVHVPNVHLPAAQLRAGAPTAL